MDLLKEISESEKYTLHSHTQFCDGHADMEDFAVEAVRQGFDLYGFSPHSPIPFDSPCNMAEADVPVYLAEVKRLQEKYPSVRFLAGMEIDYLGDHWGPAVGYFQNLPLDYSIGSVHFIPNQEGEYVDIDGRYESFKRKMHEYFHGDIRYVVEKFYEQSLRMVEQGGFDIIGHFDKIKHNGALYQPGLEGEQYYKSLVEELIEKIIASGVIVEINTKAWREHQQLFPAQEHWRKLILARVPIIINSDAHYPKLINASRGSVSKALRYLQAKCQQEAAPQPN